MLQSEDGLYNIFKRLQAFAARHDKGMGSFGAGFFCFYCLSIWLSFPIALIFLPYIHWWEYPAYALAMSTVAIAINTWHDKQ